MIKDSLCVVIPVYNAQRTLEELTEKLTGVLSQFESYSIVFVDDASPDGSFETLRKLKESNENITAIKLKENAGQQAAVLCGLRQSECDYTVIMDDDLENDPGDIMKLYERIMQGPDVVYGVCAQPTKGALRSFGSSFRETLITRLSGKPKDKKVCSFRIMTKDIVEKVRQADTKFVYISLEILKHTKKIDNIEVDYCTSHRTGYHIFSLFALAVKMYVYYGESFKFMRKKGAQYVIEEVV